MNKRNSLILAFLTLVSCALAGTWITSPGKGSHAAAAGGFTPSSATWDGGNDRMKFSGSAVTMSGSGKQLTASFWINLDNITGFKYLLFGRNDAGTGPLWRIGVSNNEIQVLVQNSTPVTVVQFVSDPVLTAATWHHVLISFDTAVGASYQIYIDGVDRFGTDTTFTADAVLALDRSGLFIGGDDGFGSDFAGCAAEIWLDDSRIDFSNSANRDKFYLAGDPVNLGATGNTPTGSAPDLYMRFVAGSLGVNSGADGGTATLEGDVTNGDCGAVGN